MNEDLIACEAGRHRTLGAFINFSADHLGPGRVAYAGQGPFYLGELDGSDTPRLRELERALSGFTDITVTDNIFGYLWTKLGYGAMVSASGIVDLDQADAFERHRALMVELGSETYEVALKEGIDLPSVNGIAPNLYMPRASRDWAAIDLAVWRRETAVEHTAGTAVEMGARHGLELPLTRALIRMVHEIEQGQRGLQPANLDELDAMRRKAATA